MSLLPTRRLAAVAVVLALAITAAGAATGLPAPIGMSLFFVVVIGLGMLDGVLGTSPSQLVVTRRHAPIVVMGSESEIEWVLSSSSGRDLRVLVADALAPSLGAQLRRFAVTVPAGQEVSVRSTLCPSRRGRFPIPTLTVRIVGRLGLGARQREVPLLTVLRVHPRFPSKGQAELKLRNARFLAMGQRSTKGLGGGTEFEQLKDYVPDEEHRRIDWVATARTGRPIVRTYRTEKNQTVLVMLDNGRVQAGLVAGVPRVEHGMDAAMMLATLATGLGDQCGLMVFDRRVRSLVKPARNKDQVARVANAMYQIEPELAESDYFGAFAQVVTGFRRRMLIVLLTDLVDNALEDSLIPALPTLTRKHLVVVGAIRDPQIEAWSECRVDGEGLNSSERHEVLSRRIAALESLASRERSAARLRAMGVRVVDVGPSALATKLGDAYLLIKGAGSL